MSRASEMRPADRRALVGQISPGPRGITGSELRAAAYRTLARHDVDVALEVLLSLLGAPPESQRFSPRR